MQISPVSILFPSIVSSRHLQDVFKTCLQDQQMFAGFIFIDVIKTVTLFITYTLLDNFIFLFNLEKVQSYRLSNSIEVVKVNAKF